MKGLFFILLASCVSPEQGTGNNQYQTKERRFLNSVNEEFDEWEFTPYVSYADSRGLFEYIILHDYLGVSDFFLEQSEFMYHTFKIRTILDMINYNIRFDENVGRNDPDSFSLVKELIEYIEDINNSDKQTVKKIASALNSIKLKKPMSDDYYNKIVLEGRGEKEIHELMMKYIKRSKKDLKKELSNENKKTHNRMREILKATFDMEVKYLLGLNKKENSKKEILKIEKEILKKLWDVHLLTIKKHLSEITESLLKLKDSLKFAGAHRETVGSSPLMKEFKRFFDAINLLLVE